MFSRTFNYRSLLIVLAIGIVSVFALSSAGIVVAVGEAWAVYTMTNATEANAIAIFNRAANGTLTPVVTVSTGGLGTGGGLGNQGGLVLGERTVFSSRSTRAVMRFPSFACNPRDCCWLMWFRQAVICRLA